MPTVLPVFPGEPLYEERVRIDDRDYVLLFDFSAREDRVYLNIFDQDEVTLVRGLKIVPNMPLLFHHQANPKLPQGLLVAFDLEQGGAPPGLDDFGTRVRLFYYDEGEDISEGV